MLHRLLLPILALVPLAGKALDLTPAPGFRQLEGINIPIVRFTDGPQKVVFQPPTGWHISGGGTFLNLSPENRTDVLMQLRVSAEAPRKPGVPEDLEAWCSQFLPKEAAKTKCEGATDSPFTLRALPSHEFIYTYASDGCRFTTSVAVVDLTPRERVSVIVTARTPDFKAARDEVIRSLFTMNWSD